MYKFAVFGNPVHHSLSPKIHNLFAKQTGILVQYDAIECSLSRLEATVREFFLDGGHGANITLPFKERAYLMATTTSPAATLAGAANTLCWSGENTMFADNTDGVGLITDLTSTHGLDLTHCKILLLGAGGAARGVLGPLLQASKYPVTVVNRNLLKAQQLAHHFNGSGVVNSCSYVQLSGQHYDVIINATSASLAGILPALPDTLLVHGTLAYDLMYADKPTIFMQWAIKQGANDVCDGLGMLLEQAAASFFLWTGRRPEVNPVHLQLRRSVHAADKAAIP